MSDPEIVHICQRCSIGFSEEDPTLHQRKMFQPFVDVFNAAIRWHKADNYDKTELTKELDKSCAKALGDIAQFAIDSYLATLPKTQEP